MPSTKVLCADVNDRWGRPCRALGAHIDWPVWVAIRSASQWSIPAWKVTVLAGEVSS